MRARFAVQQLPVKVVQRDGIAYVYICQNETEGEEQYPDMGDSPTTEHYYEYDYNEIIGPADKLPLDDIQAHPGDYLEYVYREATLEERLAALETAQLNMKTRGI